jgi:hypothetical protein
MENNMYVNDREATSGREYTVQQMQMPVQDYTAVPQNVMPVNCNEAMTVTSLNDLRAYSAGVPVRFPDFAQGQPFIARVRRPSMLALAKLGKIPNTLLAAASELFSKGGKGVSSDEKTLADMYEICRIICEASLIQPTLRDIEEAGLSLSDEQLMSIFSYTQVGVKALETFRKE